MVLKFLISVMIPDVPYPVKLKNAYKNFVKEQQLKVLAEPVIFNDDENKELEEISKHSV